MKRKIPLELPKTSELKTELKREQYKQRYRRTLRSTVSVLIVVAAVAVLASTLWFPAIKIFGDSMSPTLRKGEIVVAVKGNYYKPGDVVGFYYGNKLLIKRFIAGPGDWVNIANDGTVYVNDIELAEPYLKEKAFGDCNIKLPYQVPEGRYFVLGDHRAISIDSRNATVGCIAEEQMVGKIFFCIWPFSEFGQIKGGKG
ncbi:MAG: signal peptidase I [Clostridia bacterium]|nr:signal peptidase I [Clostridia bacterium]